MKPIGYKTDSLTVNETHSFTLHAKGSSSTRGARKDKTRTTRYLKRGEYQHCIKEIKGLINGMS